VASVGVGPGRKNRPVGLIPRRRTSNLPSWLSRYNQHRFFFRTKPHSPQGQPWFLGRVAVDADEGPAKSPGLDCPKPWRPKRSALGGVGWWAASQCLPPVLQTVIRRGKLPARGRYSPPVGERQPDVGARFHESSRRPSSAALKAGAFRLCQTGAIRPIAVSKNRRNSVSYASPARQLSGTNADRPAPRPSA